MKKYILIALILSFGVFSISTVTSADYDGFSITLDDGDYLSKLTTINDTIDIYSNSYSDLYIAYCNYSGANLEDFAKSKAEDYGFTNFQKDGDFITSYNSEGAFGITNIVICNNTDSVVILCGDDLDKLKEIAITVKFR